MTDDEIIKISLNLPKEIVDYVDQMASEEKPRLNRQQMIEKIIRDWQNI